MLGLRRTQNALSFVSTSALRAVMSIDQHNRPKDVMTMGWARFQRGSPVHDVAWLLNVAWSKRSGWGAVETDGAYSFAATQIPSLLALLSYRAASARQTVGSLAARLVVASACPVCLRISASEIRKFVCFRRACSEPAVSRRLYAPRKETHTYRLQHVWVLQVEDRRSRLAQAKVQNGGCCSWK